ncbi:MAG: class I SAM-dependent methyltransferase [Candidatus Kapaibacterium sp.]|nr:MAG: class I SAM-dependent methyltransferase [Candidatus Kapabacteria bacterium]
MPFNDHFSLLSSDYARHRPRYPDALFQFLAEYLDKNLAKPHLAWDCATGSGQAATALAKHFPRIIATDASREQIAQAEPAANVEYCVATAESSGLETASVGLCTVAQALHWFDWQQFYAEVRRVVQTGGLLAVWTYTHSTITPEIDATMQDFYQFVRPYFPPERRWVDEKYATIDFPFAEISTPDFFMEAAWNLEDVLGYYRSWSGVARYQTEHGESPLSRAEAALRGVWQQPDTPLPVRWKLHLRLGLVE